MTKMRRDPDRLRPPPYRGNDERIVGEEKKSLNSTLKNPNNSIASVGCAVIITGLDTLAFSFFADNMFVEYDIDNLSQIRLLLFVQS